MKVANVKGYSILIVDDEKPVSDLLSKVLRREGYHTTTAENGEQALEMINLHHVDLVITDIRMPGISGIELLDQVRHIDPSIKVVLITAFATLDTAIAALKNGARDYITKPFNIDEVVFSINRILASHSEGESELAKTAQDIEGTEDIFVSHSPAMSDVLSMMKRVADTKANVLLIGETGTGKELAAQALHDLSSRKDQPLIKVNCAAIPDTLLESELFGYEKGAFTGAMTKKPGKFELADGGTIFLDEIGDVSSVIQVKLLRVLQEKTFERLGGSKTIKADVRIIAATNRNLRELVAKGEFREDLYYRLNVVPIHLPPLRERIEDIVPLIHRFLLKSAQISNRDPKILSEKALKILLRYPWPGNIRELENTIERCVVVTESNCIEAEDLPGYILESQAMETTPSPNLEDTVDNAEKEVIKKVLSECGGNRTKASEMLGISRRSLHRKISKYGIEE